MTTKGKTIQCLLFAFLAGIACLHAQIWEPVKWRFYTEPIQGSQHYLVFEATIDPGWYIYSQHIHGDGPVPTTIVIEANSSVTIEGTISETGDLVKQGMDEVFGIEIKKFGKRAIFKQKVTVVDYKAVVRGYVEFMTCDDEKCLPPTQVDFSFTFPAEPNMPVDKFSSSSAATVIEQYTNPSQQVAGSTTSILPDNAPENPLTDFTHSPPSSTIHRRTIWGIFVAGFIGGLLALLTPCVFPIIPMTVSFFTKTSQTRQKGILNAFLYSIAIVVIYVSLGFLVTKAMGADALNDMASNAFFNLSFFVIFIIFAISFFGYFEITLPAAWVNRVDRMSDRGGLIGIFFMAFTLSLVSFSCTGPIIGTLLVEAAIGGSTTGPLMGMLGFSLALALPFGVFAAFPTWLHSLPKSGGWLNSVKVVLGFLELGLALKFLSNVDLAYHWGILKREIFLGIWIVLAVLTGLYLLGRIRFPHDSAVIKITPIRWVFASIFFAFALYLIPGLSGANLKLLSGFPPPSFYSIFNTQNKCPHNISCFKDLKEGMEYARRVNKPVMIDFTGWSCVNCRKMEENVWIEPDILKMLKEEYVLISLYVDDKTPLPDNEQRISACTGKKIRTIGNKWSEYQTCTFKTNTQPYYVLLNHQGELLTEPVGYTPDVKAYKKFLEKGLSRL